MSASLRARVRGRTRRRSLTARARSSRTFYVTVPRLGRGSYRVTLRAVDRAGNRARSATVVAYRLR